MARPQKLGLSYFPFDSDFFDQMGTKLLFHSKGGIGITLYIFILTQIYRREGYYYQLDDMLIKFISFEFKISESEFNEIIECCIKCELFDERLWKENKILTSEYIQDVYQCAKKSMRRILPIKVDRDIWLLSEIKTEDIIVFGNSSEIQF